MMGESAKVKISFDVQFFCYSYDNKKKKEENLHRTRFSSSGDTFAGRASISMLKPYLKIDISQEKSTS